MKIWYNKIHDSRRSMVEIESDEISIGRDAGNTLVLKSPLVSKRQAVIERSNGKLKLTNVGINSCMVGDEEVPGGEERSASGRTRSTSRSKRRRRSAASSSKRISAR